MDDAEGEKRYAGYWLFKRALREPWEVPVGCFHFLLQAFELLPDDESIPEEPSFAWTSDA